MEIIQGDCLDVMKTFADNHFSTIVTDPPYGLKFMGKEWDHGIPGIPYWQEALRIVKPGSFLLAFGGSRTFHRLTCAIEDVGWEVRDCLSWLYGSGFPKSHNHFGIKGYGTALKPAWEPIIMAMKPCDGTFKQNAEKWGQAGINIEDCRVGNESIKTISNSGHRQGFIKGFQGCDDMLHHGRWPANLILDEEAAVLLDEQSGTSRSSDYKNHEQKQSGDVYQWSGCKTKYTRSGGYLDSGGASRFFYCAKASTAERGEKNKHPTVKPLKLMEYLIKLVMPPEKGLLLDPFAGSGSTILAAKNLGFDAIGIEKSSEYCEIAKARVA